MEDTNKPIFIDGYITRDILDTQPVWLLGKGAIHVKKMIAFLQANEKYADKGGWIPYQTLRSKDKGTRYSQIDMYQVNKSIEGAKPSVEPKYDMTDKEKINDEVSDKLFGQHLTEEEHIRLENIPF
jgi:hypothetical protein